MLVSSAISLVVRGMLLGISEWIKQPWIGTSCEEVIDYAMIDAFSHNEPAVCIKRIIMADIYRTVPWDSMVHLRSRCETSSA